MLDRRTSTKPARCSLLATRTDRTVETAYERRNAAYAELERRRAKETKTSSTLSDDDIVQEVEAPLIGDGTAPADRADHSANGKGS